MLVPWHYEGTAPPLYAAQRNPGPYFMYESRIKKSIHGLLICSKILLPSNNRRNLKLTVINCTWVASRHALVLLGNCPYCLHASDLVCNRTVRITSMAGILWGSSGDYLWIICGLSADYLWIICGLNLSIPPENSSLYNGAV